MAEKTREEGDNKGKKERAVKISLPVPLPSDNSVL